MTPFSDHISPVAATTSLNVCAFMIYTFHGFRHRFSAFSFWSFFLMGRSPMPACPSRFLTLRLCPGIFSLPSSSPPSASWGRPLRLFIDSIPPALSCVVLNPCLYVCEPVGSKGLSDEPSFSRGRDPSHQPNLYYFLCAIFPFSSRCVRPSFFFFCHYSVFFYPPFYSPSRNGL
jgi:hypothetical protein